MADDPAAVPAIEPNRYQQIIERIFFSHYEEGAHDVEFARDDMVRVATELDIVLPKNLGDVVYSFRYRIDLPKSVQDKAPTGQEWIIQPAKRSRYRFHATALARIVPNQLLVQIKVPDATPGIIAMYALGDEQALLAKLRYNRLIDIFTGVTCYSLQNHLRTAVPHMGQVETDELYVGMDRRGAHYAFPVQAKGKKDKVGIVQIEQDFALCRAKFPRLICRPIAAQLMEDDAIALFEFVETSEGVALSQETHYRLVMPDSLTPSDLDTYRSLSSR